MNIYMREFCRPQVRRLSTNIIFLQEAFQEKNPNEIVLNQYNQTSSVKLDPDNKHSSENYHIKSNKKSKDNPTILSK